MSNPFGRPRLPDSTPCRNGHEISARYRRASGVLSCRECDRAASLKHQRSRGSLPRRAEPRGMPTMARVGFYTGPREPNGCRLWTGVLDSAGYATLGVDGSGVHVSRLILGLKRGDPAHARHACDTPACVEPSHLRPGTPRDNSDDKVSRRRHPHGERHPSAKLTEAEVLKIRRLRAAGASARELAERYGVRRQSILAAVDGLHWGHVK